MSITNKPRYISVLWRNLAVMGIGVALALAGCSAPTPMVQVVRLSAPAQLLTCKAQPVPPAIEADADLAEYMLDLAEAGADCRSKLGAVAGLLKDQKETEK